MKRLSITFQPKQKQSEVVIAPHFLFSEQAAQEFRDIAPRFALFCNEQIAALHGNKWALQLQNQGLNIALFTFPAGEREKSRERKAQLEDLLFSEQLGSDTCMIALGGGVTTDLVGFLASTYCRGVPLVFVPTTLLAMVDAAIGGKTGINTRFGKNLLGTYYPADKIFIDTSLLSSLPQDEWTNGLAEVIKYACIRSPTLFATLKVWRPEELDNVVEESILIKMGVVEKDCDEKAGLRRILNFGHTIAHALELLENFKLSHGQAVAIGICVESYLSMKMGYLSSSAFDEIYSLIRSFPFVFQLSSNVTVEKMHGALALDKKASQGTARFVLLEKLGACHPFGGEYCTAVPKNILDEALAWMVAQFGEKP
jgi:3-dehydroquinate synthase